MQTLKLAVSGIVALAAMAGTAVALPNHIGAASKMNPVLVAEHCAPGYHWVAAGYGADGNFHPAHCARD